ncbi:hypothetical protein N8E87_04985 [Avibacterium paragallinarum]|uniref:hypothetical protein n=1 Tax=Avibacterium paragallinarum TaxID=728 RepID=UPI0021F6DDC2|nr:hypothetical protein [Avibacterium paragallinarum]UXN37820.1 hypothetical protein N8E87_04985 [Avibacterium paragallinarum]
MCKQCKKCPECAGQDQTNPQVGKSPSVPGPVVPYLLLIDVANQAVKAPADAGQKVQNLVVRNAQSVRSAPLDVLKAGYYEKRRVVVMQKSDLEGLQAVLAQAKQHHRYLVELHLNSSLGDFPYSLLRHSEEYITQLKQLIKALTPKQEA